LGAFPNPRRATVIWLGVTRGEDRLTELADLCEEAAQSAGFPPEDRPFHPHLTLSRVRPAEKVVDLLASEPPPPIRTTVDRVTLFRSHLGRGGAVYEPIEEFPLS
jgi:RNA 2',3'-cyclic 3'-phosphodiesterase